MHILYRGRLSSMGTKLLFRRLGFLCAGSLLLVTLRTVNSDPLPETFQKPHFQVEHKAGVLSITATKDKADVDVKSDTIRLVVKPGDKQLPADALPELQNFHVDPIQPSVNMACCSKKSKVDQSGASNTQ